MNSKDFKKCPLYVLFFYIYKSLGPLTLVMLSWIQILCHVSPFAKVPEEFANNTKSSGLRFLTTWARDSDMSWTNYSVWNRVPSVIKLLADIIIQSQVGHRMVFSPKWKSGLEVGYLCELLWLRNFWSLHLVHLCSQQLLAHWPWSTNLNQPLVLTSQL